jgi:hypothetical protein
MSLRKAHRGGKAILSGVPGISEDDEIGMVQREGESNPAYALRGPVAIIIIIGSLFLGGTAVLSTSLTGLPAIALFLAIFIPGSLIGTYVANPGSGKKNAEKGSPSRNENEQQSDTQVREAYATHTRSNMMEASRRMQEQLLGDSHIPPRKK